MVGRPTILNEDLIAKAIAYLDSYQDNGEIVPTKAGLSLFCKITRDTVNCWARGQYPDKATQEHRDAFSYILETLESQQELKLISGGLGGGYNPTIAKMMMTRHGYSDKVETDHKSSDGSMAGTKELNITVTKPKGN